VRGLDQIQVFRFKQFSVRDDRSTMKVGTDAVLLGAWVNVGGAKTILDIGTGCGVIALMLAQRSKALVEAVEPDKDSAQQAEENFQASPWQISLYNVPIQDFDHEKYDLIVSNPPFFSRSLVPPATTRKIARHTETLSFEDLLASVRRLLKSHGRFALVLPVVEGNEFLKCALDYGLSCIRSTAFYSRPGKPQERWLMEFAFGGNHQENQSDSLVLYENGDQWTEAYRHLTADFYL
jgi:tRNA1Val (adenine37-N6)-methyltransferase